MDIMRRFNLSRRPVRSLIVAALCLCVAPAFAADLARVTGSVREMDGDPVVGARVVYRLVDTDGVFISTPTDAAGSYAVEIPAGERCRPVAVVVADGTRVELGEVSPARATDGMSQEITIDQPRSWNPSAIVQNFTGSDRLFRSYAEDTAIVERFRFEAQVRIQEGDSFDRGLLNLIGTAQFEAIPDVEFGVALRAVGANTLSGMSGEGLGDTDLWAKYVLGPSKNSRYELAFGAVATVPTGAEDKGAGFDSFRSDLFVAGRREFSMGVLTGNLSVALNGNGRFFGFGLDGKTALGVSVGVIVPWTFRTTFIGEASYEGERFGGFGDQAALLGGVNVLLKGGSIRGAVGLGLADGSPDVEVIVGYAFPL